MPRKQLREAFLAEQGFTDANVIALDQDASHRQYFRIEQSSQTHILMDAPPSLENPKAFVDVSNYLTALGARVPVILATDLENGFILLEDLGAQTMTNLLNAGTSETALYQEATSALVNLHHGYHNCKEKPALPNYDLATLLNETKLFTQWYLPARLDQAIDPEVESEYQQIWTHLYAQLPQLPPVLVHRDYHVDNLMMVDGQCAMLDFQDALIGSPIYDLVSLLEDARRDVDPNITKNTIKEWISTQGIDTDSFWQHYHFWGAQRHSKVLGIFVRLWLRDNKQHYLVHLDRVMMLLNEHLKTPQLNPLKQFLHELLDTTSSYVFKEA